MRKCIIVLLLIMSMNVKAQINVREHTPSPTSKPYVVRYDSLTNIQKIQNDSITHHKSYKHLIGQIFYYIDVDSVHKKDDSSFYTLVQNAYKGNYIDKSKYRNRYWRVKDIIEKPNGLDVFELEDTTNNEKIYASGNAINRDFVVLGYYEKMKQEYLGKQFIYENYFPYGIADGADNDKCNNLINYETNAIGDSIPIGSVWNCIDISAYNITHHDYWTSAHDRRCPVILVFENEVYGKYYSYTQNRSGMTFDDTKYCFWPTAKGHKEERIPLYFGKFLDLEQQVYISKRENETKQYYSNQRKNMVAKYGKYWGKLVADGHLTIGMTKQMCKDCWGEPDSINRTSTRYNNYEQWVYSTTYVYFENGKISIIQDR